jgi:glyoxylase-like metal-dependent hydrolase (beta-lactamase superfamily II)
VDTVIAHFRQFHDPASASFSYLLGDKRTSLAAIIDPVVAHVPLYLGVLGELGLRLAWVLETHLHADRITAADTLREWTDAQVAVGLDTGIEDADRVLADRNLVSVGSLTVEAMATPGHTPGCLSFRWMDRLFTGDSLLIGGCGSIDEPGGNGVLLFDSVTRRLFSLPAETLVYPGHGLDGRWVSCIGEERESNPLFHGVSRDGFVVRKHAAREQWPALMDIALNANRHCGKLNLRSQDGQADRKTEAVR